MVFRGDLNRRDFLKLSGLLPPGILANRLLGSLPSKDPGDGEGEGEKTRDKWLVNNLSEISNAAEFNLGGAANQRMIKFAFDVAKRLNAYKPSDLVPRAQWGRELSSELTNKLIFVDGHIDLVSSEEWTNAMSGLADAYMRDDLMDGDGRVEPLQCTVVPTVLGAVREHLWGAPVDMNGVTDALSLAKDLLSLRDNETHRTIGAGRAVHFENDWASVEDLLEGDTIAVRYKWGSGSHQEVGHVAAVLAKSKARDTGLPVVLVCQANRYVGLDEKRRTDGQMRFQWMDQAEFDEQFGKASIAKMAVLRSHEMCDIGIERKQWKLKYERAEASLIEDPKKKFTREEEVELWDWIYEKAKRETKTFEERMKVVEQELFRFQIIHYPSSALMHSLGHYCKYEDESAWFMGLAGAHTMNEIMWRVRDPDNHKTGQVHFMSAINNTANRLTRPGMTLAKAMQDPSFFADLERGLVLRKPKNMDEVFVGDTLFLAEIDKMETRFQIGTVVNYEKRGSKAKALIIFDNWKGTGVAKEIVISSIEELRSLKAKDFAILRSEKVEKYDYVWHKRKEHILSYDQLPPQMKDGDPDRQYEASEIPVIAKLQKELWNAKTSEQRAELIMQICAQMGVETSDNAQEDPKRRLKYRYTDNDPNLCNLYSAQLCIFLLGLQISHFEQGGKPVIAKDGRKDISELSAVGMSRWLEQHGEEYGWINVGEASEAERLRMLEEGYIIYYAEPWRERTWGDTGVIFGIHDKEGKTVPVISKASNNNLMSSPYNDAQWINPEPDSLWAHKIPMSTAEEKHKPSE